MPKTCTSVISNVVMIASGCGSEAYFTGLQEAGLKKYIAKLKIRKIVKFIFPFLPVIGITKF